MRHAMTIYTPILFGLMAAFFLIIGLRVITRRKPVFVPGSYFLIMVIAAFSPQLINTISALFDRDANELSLLLLFNLLLLACLFMFMRRQMKGYMLIGIHDDSFREALLAALNKNNLTYEEKLSKITLTEKQIDLQVAIQSWMGTGQLRLKGPSDPSLLKTIVAGVNDFYTANDIKPNMITAVFYTVIGTLMVAGAGFFAFVLW